MHCSAGDGALSRQHVSWGSRVSLASVGGSDAEPPPPQADPNDPGGDYDGNGKTERHELKRADQRLWDGEITAEEYRRIWRKYACDSGDTHECGK